MEEIFISYLILVHNETESLKKLVSQLENNITHGDEIVVIDDFSENEETRSILDSINSNGHKVFQNKLNGDFANQKNFGNSKCINKYIFNIDSDEYLDEYFIKNLKEILSLNNGVELIYIPRINTVEGITLSHVQRWKWNISSLSTELQQRPIEYDSDEYRLLRAFNLIIEDDNGMIKYFTPIVNWPDYQSRIYVKSDTIKWFGKVHETIVGYRKYSKLPMERKYALIHPKNIVKQEMQNRLYEGIISQ